MNPRMFVWEHGPSVSFRKYVDGLPPTDRPEAGVYAQSEYR